MNVDEIERPLSVCILASLNKILVFVHKIKEIWRSDWPIEWIWLREWDECRRTDAKHQYFIILCWFGGCVRAVGYSQRFLISIIIETWFQRHFPIFTLEFKRRAVVSFLFPLAIPMALDLRWNFVFIFVLSI